jgi:magnesium-transporting ATPase (P-type)
MSKIVVCLDLTAGILIAAQLLIPRRLYEKLDKKIRELVALEPGAEDPGYIKSLYTSIAIAITFFIIFIAWAIHEDLGRGIFTVGQITLTTILTILGVIIGIGVLVGIAMARRHLRYLQGRDPIMTVMTTSLGLAVLTIILVGIVSAIFRPILIGIASASLILGVIMEGVPLTRKYLTFQEGVLARLGILVFIASKIIQLAS